MIIKGKILKTSLMVKYVLVCTLFLSVLMSCEVDETQTVARFTNLVLEDNFSTDGAPNPNIWDYEIGRGDNGWGNNELQYYTDRSENVTIQNGYLLITAREEAFESANYTSARLITRGLFEQQYGRFEARIRLPYGKGLWPAFWLLGNDCEENIWPQCGEIDVMEYLGDSPTKVFGSVHGPGYSGANAETKEYFLENGRFDTDFHIFGIEWGPDYINYYVDDELYNQITIDDVPGEWVFDHPFYIIMNVAVGGNLPGSPNDETVFPQTMLVDYVRVYSN